MSEGNGDLESWSSTCCLRFSSAGLAVISSLAWANAIDSTVKSAWTSKTGLMSDARLLLIHTGGSIGLFVHHRLAHTPGNPMRMGCTQAAATCGRCWPACPSSTIRFYLFIRCFHDAHTMFLRCSYDTVHTAPLTVQTAPHTACELVTPRTKFGSRIHYDIKEFTPLVDSCNLVTAPHAPS